VARAHRKRDSIRIPAAASPLSIADRGGGPPPRRFRVGAHAPFGVRWYGVTALYGHLRNFVARAIASEEVDSRDWMRPEEASAMLAHTIGVLGGDATKATLVEALGRPLWIDFVADTGDDRDIAHAVGKMLASRYAIEHEGAERVLPRGELLVFGGDIAYPVATADEIYRRLIRPWNEALRAAGTSPDDPPRRALLGVPGNHDWYDGLDGFGRMFRRKVDEPFARDESTGPSSRILGRLRRAGRRAGLVARQLHLDEVGGLVGLLYDAWRSIRAFFRGVGVRRRRRLALRGYEPVQEASYFAMPLTATLEMWGVDRQLSRLDFRQRNFFKRRRRDAAAARILFVASDPAFAFGERHDLGMRNLGACKLAFDRDEVFYLTGDYHHYERRTLGRSTHVIAGGGGAFLHGTRIAPYPGDAPVCAYPDAAMSRTLVAQVPLKLMLGQAGLLVHLAAALIASAELAAAQRSAAALSITTGVITFGICAFLYFIAGHHRAHPRRIAAASVPFGVALGVMPTMLKLALPQVVPRLAGDTGVMVVYALAASFIFGFFLMSVAIAGLEAQQAFTVLGHPGFKHFVRMCVHPSGKIEAWTIGKDDPLDDRPPAIVDRFVW
jgi:hypothetical protein